MQPQEEYPLFLEQVNKLAERRQGVTSTYLTVNAAILGALAFLFKDGQMPGWSHGVSALLLFLAGMVACDLWRRLLKQHSTLLSWWYERLRTLETAMPECSKLVTHEYEELYTAKRPGPRWPHTVRDRSDLALYRAVRRVWAGTACCAHCELVVNARPPTAKCHRNA